LIDDPLRSVQSLPGVATNDDFNPDFAVRGFGFWNVGFYIDGALLHSPFHTVRDITDGGGLTVLNGDMLESASLLTSGAPARFGDRTGAALNLQTREGSREQIYFRGTLSITGASATAEGPIGRSRKASWLLSARKSYLDYVINRIAEDPTFVFGYQDIQSKLSYDFSDRQQLRLLLIFGKSDLNRDRILSRLGINSLRNGSSSTRLYSINWRSIPSTRTVVQTQIYGTTEFAENTNRSGETLFQSRLRHAGFRSDVNHHLTPNASLEGGIFLRHLDQSENRRRFDFVTNQFRTRNEFSGTGWNHSGYVESSVTLAKTVTLRTGVRAEYFNRTAEQSVLPRASVRIRLAEGTQVIASFGQNLQFPDMAQLYGEFRNPRLQGERSTQYSLALEQGLTEKTRIRAEAYDHSLRSGVFAPETDWRLVDGNVTGPTTGEVLHNSLRGHSRGVELFLQRRSANMLSGWISYSYSQARWHDSVSGLAFDSDFDQRHTFNAYGSYRITNTMNVSTKYRYGSAFPISGFYRSEGGEHFLSATRNQARQPFYSRLDVRLNKAFVFNRWRLTLFTEVVNVLNRKHIQYTGLEFIEPNTHRVFLDHNDLLPFVPTVGLSIEF
jgi:hypothetical protein